MGKHVAVPGPDELEEDRPRLIVHDGVPYCLMKHDGKVRAFVAACSHKDRAIVPLRLKKGTIPCPFHGATFDPLTGEVDDERGNKVPEGMPAVELIFQEDGSMALHVRKKHRKYLSKKERKRVAKLDALDHAAEVGVGPLVR